MARGIYLVFSRPVSPGREGEYNDWYDNVHIPDCLKVPGWCAATRYRRSTASAPHPKGTADPLGGRQYLTVYDFEAPDLQDPLDAVRAASARGEIVLSDAIEMDPRPYNVVFERYEASSDEGEREV